MEVVAKSPEEAVNCARRRLGREPTAVDQDVYAVYRPRRVRGRKLVGYFGADAGGSDDDGLAGVREPRRPVPDPSSAARHLDLPDTS